MSGPVTQIESELLFVEVFAIEERLGALRKPIVLRHFLNEHLFGDGGGLVLGGEVALQLDVERFVFGREKAEVTGETMGEPVEGGDGFTGFGFGTGGELGVEPVGSELVGGRLVGGGLRGAAAADWRLASLRVCVPGRGVGCVRSWLTSATRVARARFGDAMSLALSGGKKRG